MTKHPVVLTAQQAADELDVPLRTLHNWIAAGEFPDAVKLGDGLTSAYMIPRANVEAKKRARAKLAQAR